MILSNKDKKKQIISKEKLLEAKEENQIIREQVETELREST